MLGIVSPRNHILPGELKAIMANFQMLEGPWPHRHMCGAA